MWEPLEANPEVTLQVVNKLLPRLGVPDKWRVMDVISLHDELLGLVPKPTLAMFLFFPQTDASQELRKKQEDNIREKGQEISSEVYYLKPAIPKPCGSMMLIHALANNLDSIKLEDGVLKQFIEDSKSMSPEERGVAFVSKEEFATALAEVVSSTEGQTKVFTENNPVHHFLSFVCKDGSLYELDGSRPFAINHGPSSPESFLKDAAKVIVRIMNEDPEELRFVVWALAANRNHF